MCTRGMYAGCTRDLREIAYEVVGVPEILVGISRGHPLWEFAFASLFFLFSFFTGARLKFPGLVLTSAPAAEEPPGQ